MAPPTLLTCNMHGNIDAYLKPDESSIHGLAEARNYFENAGTVPSFCKKNKKLNIGGCRPVRIRPPGLPLITIEQATRGFLFFYKWDKDHAFFVAHRADGNWIVRYGSGIGLAGGNGFHRFLGIAHMSVHNGYDLDAVAFPPLRPEAKLMQEAVVTRLGPKYGTQKQRGIFLAQYLREWEDDSLKAFGPPRSIPQGMSVNLDGITPTDRTDAVYRPAMAPSEQSTTSDFQSTAENFSTAVGLASIAGETIYSPVVDEFAVVPPASSTIPTSKVASSQDPGIGFDSAALKALQPIGDHSAATYHSGQQEGAAEQQITPDAGLHQSETEIKIERTELQIADGAEVRIKTGKGDPEAADEVEVKDLPETAELSSNHNCSMETESSACTCHPWLYPPIHP